MRVPLFRLVPRERDENDRRSSRVRTSGRLYVRVHLSRVIPRRLTVTDERAELAAYKHARSFFCVKMEDGSG